MNSSSNVFYLPAHAPVPEPVEPPTRWSIFRARMARRWWRMRIMLSEIRGIVRGRDHYAVDLEFPGLAQPSEAAVESSGPSRGPARVIDFHAARARLRPSTALAAPALVAVEAAAPES
jgi:hypothetical protein